MAQGHIIQFMALALDIERRKNYQITFINTPLNINKLKSSPPPTSSIRLRSIPFDSTLYGLPPNTENTDGLPYSLIFRLALASFAMETDLRKLVQEIVQEETAKGSDGLPPLCIITDIFFAWVGRVAHDFNIFHAIFATTSGLGMACYYSLWSTVPQWNVEGAKEFEMVDFPEGGKVQLTQISPSMFAADGNDEPSVFQKRMCSEWLNADAALFNTVEEIDRVGLSYFRRKIQRPVWAIGPILNQDRGEKDREGCISRKECKEWLDSKPSRSVVYVCFGSQNTLSSSQMMEMAMALETSGRWFIWMVRPPLGEEFASELKTEDFLPVRFEKRVKGRGLVVWNWAPQMEILSHGSTGAFISHCGWNSTVDAISYGVPIIAWPMAAEQFFNVKLLEGELGICVAVGRGNACKVKCEDIVRKIDMVMWDSEGAMDVKIRAWKVKETIAGAKTDEGNKKGSSIIAIDEFFSTAIATRKKKQKNIH